MTLWDQFLVGSAVANGQYLRGERPFTARGYNNTISVLFASLRSRYQDDDFKVALTPREGKTRARGMVLEDMDRLAEDNTYGYLVALRHPELVEGYGGVTARQVDHRDPRAHLVFLLNLVVDAITALGIKPHLAQRTGRVAIRALIPEAGANPMDKSAVRAKWFNLLLVIRGLLVVPDADLVPLHVMRGESMSKLDKTRPLRTLIALLEVQFRGLWILHCMGRDQLRPVKTTGPVADAYYRYIRTMGVRLNRHGATEAGAWLGGPSLYPGVPHPVLEHESLIRARAADIQHAAQLRLAGNPPGRTHLHWPEGEAVGFWSRYRQSLGRATLRPSGTTPLDLHDVAYRVLLDTLGLDGKQAEGNVLMPTAVPATMEIKRIPLTVYGREAVFDIMPLLTPDTHHAQPFQVLPPVSDYNFSRLLYLDNLCADLYNGPGLSYRARNAWAGIKLLGGLYDRYTEFAPFQVGNGRTVSRAEELKPLQTVINLLQRELRATITGARNEDGSAYVFVAEQGPRGPSQLLTNYLAFLTQEMHCMVRADGTHRVGGWADPANDPLIDGRLTVQDAPQP